MRIACLDKTARGRLDLQEFVDNAFRDCRSSVGHILVAQIFPCSKQELLLNSSPDVLVVGDGYSHEELYSALQEIRFELPKIPIYVILKEEDFEYKNIERLKKIASEIFSKSDPKSRIVYELSHIGKVRADRKGELLTVSGVKGGVGTTSCALALCHAAKSLSKNAVVVDLSQHGDIAQFLLCPTWHSSGLSQVITQGEIASSKQIESLIVHADNGISILPPPFGGAEVREGFLHDASLLESSLSVIEALQEIFDLVVVDMSHAEGIFPFALECRAGVRLFICSNEPGAVHLLTSKMDKYSLPIEGETRFVVNQLNNTGLNFEDVLDFISWSKCFKEEFLYPEVIPFDSRAAGWIGSGNTMYTEGGDPLRESFKMLLSDALNLEYQANRKRKPFARTCIEMFQRKKTLAIPLEERPKIEYNLDDIVDG